MIDFEKIGFVRDSKHEDIFNHPDGPISIWMHDENTLTVCLEDEYTIKYSPVLESRVTALFNAFKNNFMTKEELAKQIDGSEYPFYPGKEIKKIAKDNNLVIVYGHSDDLVELEGALNEEVGAYGGVSFNVCKDGLCNRPSEDEFDAEDFYDRYEKYLNNKKTSKNIVAQGPPWSITTDIPHCKFNIMEDGEVQSVGIVFSLKDI